MEIILEERLSTKSYLKDFLFFEFESLLHLVFELFSNNKEVNNDNTIYDSIINLGYNNVNDIPIAIKKQLEKRYFELLESYKTDFDTEKQTYLFMAKVVSQEVLVTIDNNLIINYDNSISLESNSVISFTDLNKIDNINFTTL